MHVFKGEHRQSAKGVASRKLRHALRAVDKYLRGQAVLFVTEGKDAATVTAFADDLTAHGGDPEAIDEVCIDMSPAFIKGVAENLPNAAVTLGRHAHLGGPFSRAKVGPFL
jgi:transposase